MNINFDQIFINAKEYGCDFVELYIYKSEELAISMENTEVSKIERLNSTGIGVRVKRGLKIGFSFTTEYTEKAIMETVKKAYDISLFMEDDKDTIFNKEMKGYSKVDASLLEKLKNVSFKEKVDYLKKQNEYILQYDNVKIDELEYEESLGSSRLINSEGLDIKREILSAGAMLSIKVEDDNGSESGYDYFYTRDIDELLNKNIAKKAYEEAVSMLGANSIKTNDYKGIIKNDIVMSILGLLSSSFNGENIRKEKSMFDRESIDKKIFSENISIYDDGMDKNALFYMEYDDEGTKLKKNILVENGVLKNFVYDLKNANMENKNSTGNGSRGYTSTPGISMNFLKMEKGNTSFEELLREVNNGIIIEEVMGLHMANPITGEFSLGAKGHIIKNGKIDKPFRGVTFSGSIKKLLNDVDIVGSDYKVRINKAAPSILINSLKISGD